MKVYFLSDLHLGARYIGDRKEHEARIVNMLRQFGDDADHIFLLGDILDYWFEYKTVVPRGYIRFFGKLADLVDRGVKITWLVGNHDIWMFDYIREEIGIEIIDGAIIRTIDGQNFYMAHGDDLGKNHSFGFRFLRSLFRNKVCQKLYSAIHPRWTVPFATRWSNSSRKSRDDETFASWKGNEIEPSYIFALDYLRNVNSSINYFIFGHRHLMVDETIKPDCRFIVLGDCFRLFSYAVWDGQNLELKQFDT